MLIAILVPEFLVGKALDDLWAVRKDGERDVRQSAGLGRDPVLSL